MRTTTAKKKQRKPIDAELLSASLIRQQRSESRVDATGETIKVLTFVEVPLRNRSESGFSIRFPREAGIELNQRILVADRGERREAIVRWVRDADFTGEQQMAGCEYV